MGRWVRLLVLALAVLGAGCDSGSVRAPRPVLSSLSPTQGISTAPFVLTVNGSGFQRGSQIVFNGRAMATTVVSGTVLTCTVAPDNMAVAAVSSQVVAVPVAVRTPGDPGSGSLDFRIAIYPRFQAAVRIADATTAQSDTLRPRLALGEGGELWVVWRDREELRFSRSDDAGAHWSPPQTVHRSRQTPYRFTMAYDRSGPALLLAWEEDSTVRTLRSPDGGQTWTAPALLTDPAVAAASNPGMFVDASGTVYLAHLQTAPEGGPPYAVAILRSPNHGAGFEEVGRIPWTTYFTGDGGPRLAADRNGTLHLVFTSEFGTRYAMSYASFSTDGARTWSTPTPVPVVAPAMVVDDQNAIGVVGARMDLPYLYRMAFLRSTDQGASWVSSAFDGTGYAEADIVFNAFHSLDAVWDHRFVRSFDRGSTWGPVVAYDEETAAAGPALVEDAAGRVYLAWWDMNGAIWFKASVR